MAGNRAEKKSRSKRSANDTMGARLVRARQARDLSVAQLARRLGVKSETLRAWEANRSEPRANKVTMLAGVLGVTPSWFLSGSGRSPTRPKGEIDSIRRDMLRLADDIADAQGRLTALIERLESHSLAAD